MASSATASINPYKSTPCDGRIPVSVTRTNFITAFPAIKLISFCKQVPLHEHSFNPLEAEYVGCPKSIQPLARKNTFTRLEVCNPKPL
jgi:hypothetical protein